MTFTASTSTQSFPKMQQRVEFLPTTTSLTASSLSLPISSSLSLPLSLSTFSSLTLTLLSLSLSLQISHVCSLFPTPTLSLYHMPPSLITLSPSLTFLSLLLISISLSLSLYKRTTIIYNLNKTYILY